MFSSGTDGLTGSYNNDVLTAEPVTEEEKFKLVEEIKNRAKGCISGRNFPEAVRLYSKAIETSVTDDAANAILHANRSMCHLNMGNAKSALNDALTSQSLDPTYVKGYYREAMALKADKRFADARKALEKGLQLKSDDKEMAAQLSKIEEDIVKLKTAKPLKSATTVPTTSTERKMVPVAKSMKTSKSAAASSSPSANTKSETTDDNEDDDKDLEKLNLRGYKKTADGRVTTFFNNDLDEEAKKLIGDIAPKKIDPNDSAAIIGGFSTTAAQSNSSGSAWNSAGTYEERILTPWAMNELTSRMQAIKSTVPASEVSCCQQASSSSELLKLVLENDSPVSTSLISHIEVEVCKVENISGDAQVSMIRGKKKYICDFSLDLLWTVSVAVIKSVDDESSGTTKVTLLEGKMHVLDITADKEFEIGDIELSKLINTACTTVRSLPSSASQIFATYIKGSSNKSCLQTAIRKTIEDFCDAFKNK